MSPADNPQHIVSIVSSGWFRATSSSKWWESVIRRASESLFPRTPLLHCFGEREEPAFSPRTHLNPSESSRTLSTRQSLPITLASLPVMASLVRPHKRPYQCVTTFRHTLGKWYPSPEWNGRAISCTRSRTVSCASGVRDRSTGEVVADVSMRKLQ